MEKYEYRLVDSQLKGVMNSLDELKNEEILNSLGEKGWRLNKIIVVPRLKVTYLLERKLNSKENFSYKIKKMESSSKLRLEYDNDINNNYLTGGGLEGWRFIDYCFWQHVYFFMEKV